MFQIFKVLNEGETDESVITLEVKNQKYLLDHLMKMDIGVDRINFFSYNALPDRSYGIFIVSEKEWLAKMSDVIGDTQLSLKILDNNTFKIFKDLNIVRTASFMGPLFAAQQDGERLVLIELELSLDTAGRKNARTFNFLDTEINMRGRFENPELLAVPDEYAPDFIKTGTPQSEVLTYIADCNFLTCYLDPEDRTKLPILTAEQFNYTTIQQRARLLYSDFSVIGLPEPEEDLDPDETKKLLPKIPIAIYQYDETSCGSQFRVGVDSDIPFPPPGSYVTPVRSRSSFESDIQYEFGYSRINKQSQAEDSSHYSDFIASLFTEILPNAATRLQHHFDLIYEGVVPTNPYNDLHHIDYYFGEYGMRTRLRSREWCIDSSILSPKNYPCQDKIFKAFIVEDFPSVGTGGAKAIIKTMDPINPQIVDIEASVISSLSVFKWYRAGTELVVYKACENCEYYVIQGPCPPTAAPPVTGAAGKCCKVVGGITYCYEISTEECTLIGGTFSVGSCGPDPYTACGA